MMDAYLDQVRVHYEGLWKARSVPLKWERGPTHELPDSFRVLEIQRIDEGTWTYATCGMSDPTYPTPLEIHLHAPEADEAHVELLTAITHYHVTGARLGLGHTVNFGRPWLPGSRCDRGLVSLPYLHGPRLEWMQAGDLKVRFLWLMPITPEELEYKKARGVEALETEFERVSVNYLDPNRPSVV